MKRVMLTVSYDGTNYSGWALQSSTPNTVEGVLNRAIHGLTGEEVAVIGASRTDAGVHARQMAAHFDTNQQLDVALMVKKLNLQKVTIVIIFVIIIVMFEKMLLKNC